MNKLVNQVSFTNIFFIYLAVIAIIPFAFKYLKGVYKRYKDPVWYARIGKYVFGELFIRLNSTSFPANSETAWLRTYDEEEQDENNEPINKVEPLYENLMVLFVKNYVVYKDNYVRPYPSGDWDYGYFHLCPILKQYGLVSEHTVQIEDLPHKAENCFYFNDTSHKFYDCLNKLYKRNPSGFVKGMQISMKFFD